jgi:hypothetical protein
MTNLDVTGPSVPANDPPVIPDSVPQLVIRLCGGGSCPTIYRTDRNTVLVQGHTATGVAVPHGELLVEIPQELLIEAARRINDQDA